MDSENLFSAGHCTGGAFERGAKVDNNRDEIKSRESMEEHFLISYILDLPV